jgi:hypothetical protein
LISLFLSNYGYSQCSADLTIDATIDLNDVYASNWRQAKFVNADIYIKSDFFIDKGISFVGCNIKFDPEVKITVMLNSKLTITDGENPSHLYACTDMWDGITVLGDNSSSNGVLIINNNTLNRRC